MKNRKIIFWSILIGVLYALLVLRDLSIDTKSDLFLFSIILVAVFTLTTFIQILLFVLYYVRQTILANKILLISSILSFILFITFCNNFYWISQGRLFSSIVDNQLVSQYGIKKSIKTIDPIFNFTLLFVFTLMIQIALFYFRSKVEKERNNEEA